MGLFKVYVTPFDEDGNYGEEVEVTEFVDKTSITEISRTIEGNSDYQLGIFSFANLTISFNNRTGKFSDVETVQSLFRYKRNDSQIRITWKLDPGPYCGVAIADEARLNDETEIFKGLLNDESFSTDAQTQRVKFKILGFESLFARTVVPFDTVDNGDLMSVTMYKILNQPEITGLLTVDQANIVPGTDQTIDSIASLQNKSVREGIQNLLIATNSVLYIKDDTVYVKNRVAGLVVQHTFYGQASRLGAENIIDMNEIKNGVARVVNYASWSGTGLLQTDDDSIARNGIKAQTLDYEFITDNTKRDNILTAIVTEFSNAKQEMNLTCQLNYDTVGLDILDRVLIDYPTVYLPGEEEIPVLGFAEWGDDTDSVPPGALMPDALWSFSVSTDEPYKILSKKINTKNQTIVFRLRKI